MMASRPVMTQPVLCRPRRSAMSGRGGTTWSFGVRVRFQTEPCRCRNDLSSVSSMIFAVDQSPSTASAWFGRVSSSADRNRVAIAADSASFA